MSGVWVIAEQRDNNLRKVTFELLCQGRKIADQWGDELNVILLGQGVASLADVWANMGQTLSILLMPPFWQSITVKPTIGLL